MKNWYQKTKRMIATLEEQGRIAGLKERPDGLEG